MKKRSVYVIGDSISIHYEPYLKNLISNRFEYDRKRGVEQALKDLDKSVGANAGDSRMVLNFLGEEYNKGIRYDILLINCGLHDIRVDRHSFKKQIEHEEYRSNLVKIIEIAGKMADKVIWIGLTPVADEIHNSREEGFLRYDGDVRLYDNAAKEIMDEFNIQFIDMYNFTKNLGGNIYFDHVHFKDEIRRLQAEHIAESINNNF